MQLMEITKSNTKSTGVLIDFLLVPVELNRTTNFCGFGTETQRPSFLSQ